MRAGVEQLEQRRGRREARREAQPADAAFERREVLLERVARAVVRARVLEALVLAGRGLRVGRRVVDRRHHGAGDRIGLLAGVDRARAEAVVLVWLPSSRTGSPSGPSP